MIRGIGTDIVNVGRFRKAGERWGDRFLRRVFTEEELAYCRAKSDPYPHLAARFAAKEAVLKALSALWEAEAARYEQGSPQGLGPARVAFRDIEIANRPTGRPFIRLMRDGTPEGLFIHLSVSHEQDVAIAMVVLEKSSAETI